MILLNGVTGFYSVNQQPPSMDEKQYKQNCYSLISSMDGDVLSFQGAQTAANFFNTEVKVLNKHLHILLNEHYPFMAFTCKFDYGKTIFYDEPELLKLFSPYYTVLGTDELNESIILKLGSRRIIQNDNELNDDELTQIAYWKPERMGDILFNYWD